MPVALIHIIIEGTIILVVAHADGMTNYVIWRGKKNTHYTLL